MATSTVQVRIDEDLKNQASAVFDDLGMDLSTAIRLFLKRAVLVNGVPFEMTLPKKSTKAMKAVEALYESSAAAEVNGTSEMTLEEINAEIDAVRAKR